MKAQQQGGEHQQTTGAGDPRLNQQINYFLPPIHLSRNLSTPGVGEGRKFRPVSASNERARQGFKFWIDDSKSKNARNKVTLGSRGSFLGVGVPRLWNISLPWHSCYRLNRNLQLNIPTSAINIHVHMVHIITVSIYTIYCITWLTLVVLFWRIKNLKNKGNSKKKPILIKYSQTIV